MQFSDDNLKPFSDRPDRAVVYFTNVPFNRRDYTRYGIEWWVDNGYQVTVLDVGYFAMPSRVPDWDEAIYSNDRFSMEILRAKSELGRYADLLAGASLIVDLTTAHGHSRWNLPVLRAIARANSPYIVLSVNAYPGYDLPVGGSGDQVEKIKNFFARLRSADPINSVIVRLPFRWFGIKPATAVVYGGRRSRRNITTVTEQTLEISGHHMDYDIYLDQGQEIEADRIAVFIDQDIGGHREFADNKAFNRMDVDQYYGLLRETLKRVEKSSGLEIVIAKHPHALSNNAERFLSEWRIVQGRTFDLIRSCELVIAHNSAAITSVVLNRKPLLLIFSKAYIDSSHWNPVSHYPLAEALQRKCLFLENIAETSDEELMADLEAGFDEYFADYISTGPRHREKLWPRIAKALCEQNIIRPIEVSTRKSVA